MSLEQALADLQTAVEELTATIKGRKAAPTADAEEPAPRKRKGKKAPEPTTLEDVRAALMALNEAKGKQAVVDVLAEYGVKKIGDLEEANYAECKEAAEKATEADDDDTEGDELFE